MKNAIKKYIEFNEKIFFFIRDFLAEELYWIIALVNTFLLIIILIKK